jgi:hypothetical protein
MLLHDTRRCQFNAYFYATLYAMKMPCFSRCRHYADATMPRHLFSDAGYAGDATPPLMLRLIFDAARRHC